MRKVTFDGKEYGFKAKLSTVRFLQENYQSDIDSLMDKNKTPDPLKIEEFAVRMVWEFIQPDEKGKKPFDTFENFKDEVDFVEFNEASKKAFYMLWGLDPDTPLPPEGKESGNEKQTSLTN